MTLGSKGYVQKSRYFFNSQFKNGQADPLFHLSKTDAKRHFLQGMSFANKVDGRSYAHVLSGSTAWEGVQDVGSKRVISNYFEKITKKCSGIVSTNTSVTSASLSNSHRLRNCDNKVSKSVKHSVVPSTSIKLQNRFHVLSSVDPGPLEFEDNIILDTPTVGNNHLPKPDIAKSRYFGHSGTNNGNQTMAKESIAHKKCCEQIGTKFGCIPVGEITVFSGISTHWKDIPNMFQAHKLIRSSGRPNFLGLFLTPASKLTLGDIIFLIILTNSFQTL